MRAKTPYYKYSELGASLAAEVMMGALHKMLSKAAPGDVAASALGAGRAVALVGFVVGPVLPVVNLL